MVVWGRGLDTRGDSTSPELPNQWDEVRPCPAAFLRLEMVKLRQNFQISLTQPCDDRLLN